MKPVSNNMQNMTYQAWQIYLSYTVLFDLSIEIKNTDTKEECVHGVSDKT